MSRLLHKLINREIWILAPALFDEKKARPCQLISVETGNGVWIESEELYKEAFPDKDGTTATIFVPFAQIGFIATEMPPEPAATTPRDQEESPTRRRRR